MSEPEQVIESLKGKVHEHPRMQVWFNNPVNDKITPRNPVKIISTGPDFQNAINGDYEYTCEQPAKWSPYNCNLQMGAIKVRCHDNTSLMNISLAR